MITGIASALHGSGRLTKGVAYLVHAILPIVAYLSAGTHAAIGAACGCVMWWVLLRRSFNAEITLDHQRMENSRTWARMIFMYTIAGGSIAAGYTYALNLQIWLGVLLGVILLAVPLLTGWLFNNDGILGKKLVKNSHDNPWIDNRRVFEFVTGFVVGDAFVCLFMLAGILLT
jgi:hypothetical protein